MSWVVPAPHPSEPARSAPPPCSSGRTRGRSRACTETGGYRKEHDMDTKKIDPSNKSAIANAAEQIGQMAKKGGHKLEEATEKMSHAAEEVGLQVVHAAEEVAQKVSDRAKEVAGKAHQRVEEMKKNGGGTSPRAPTTKGG